MPAPEQTHVDGPVQEASEAGEFPVDCRRFQCLSRQPALVFAEIGGSDLVGRKRTPVLAFKPRCEAFQVAPVIAPSERAPFCPVEKPAKAIHH